MLGTLKTFYIKKSITDKQISKVKLHRENVQRERNLVS